MLHAMSTTVLVSTHKSVTCSTSVQCPAHSPRPHLVGQYNRSTAAPVTCPNLLLVLLSLPGLSLLRHRGRRLRLDETTSVEVTARHHIDRDWVWDPRRRKWYHWQPGKRCYMYEDGTETDGLETVLPGDAAQDSKKVKDSEDSSAAADIGRGRRRQGDKARASSQPVPTEQL